MLRLYSQGMVPITLVIPTLDSSSFIAQTIAHYDAMLRRGLLQAVIIVDDSSTDATWQTLCREKDTLASPILLLRLDTRYGQLIAYSAGVQRAATDIILHCDDDVLLSEADLWAFTAEFERTGASILYGLAKGKSDHPRGRSTFLWLVKTFVFYRLPDKEFSSLVLYSRNSMDRIFRRAWGFRGNLFTPWIFHPHEVYHTYLGDGSRILPHESRYSLAGYIHHQKFLFMMLARLLSLLLTVSVTACILAGAASLFVYALLILGVVLFAVSAFLIKVKSRLDFAVAESH
ncbi:MAG: glycosyltransferase family 2 protein [Bacteroidetes bacterium]|nr:glycosyltransferase family 2 protein [Bacteroidota bacterium]